MTAEPMPAAAVDPAGSVRAWPSGLRITGLPAFSDNYIWLLARAGQAAVVDPGDAVPVLRLLRAQDLRLDAILVTHGHADHTDGVAELVRETGATVYGSVRSPLPARGVRIDRPLEDLERFSCLGHEFAVLEVPGHTLDHVAYRLADAGAAFTGDTLFAAGCGRLFEGSPEQMFASLQRLARLPEDTLIYCAHEYTVSNLRFALAVEPENEATLERMAQCQQWRKQGRPTVPSTLGLEMRTNPFLRCDNAAVRASALAHAPQAERSALERALAQGSPSVSIAVFAALRAWKNAF